MREQTIDLKMDLDGRISHYILGPLAGLELCRFVPNPPPVYIMDQTVADLHPNWLEQIQEACDHCDHQILLLPGGEDVKSLARLDEIFHWLAEHKTQRDTTLVAVGGGTILDLAGLAAATWRRGLNYVAFPTTLLAMVDAAIGGKTAVNTAGLKNPVGCFHPAAAVLADCGFLNTLSRQCWRDGLAELIKTAAVGDAKLFNSLVAHQSRLSDLLKQGHPDEPIPGVVGALPWRRWIEQAARVKAGIVTQDPWEKGPRRALNLGHTLGHVLEAWSHKTDSPLSHGQAVSIGMAVVFRIAAERALCPVPMAVQMVELLEACGLPVTYPAIPSQDMTHLLANDKKTYGNSNLLWVLPRKVGEMSLVEHVSVEELVKWLT